MTRDMTDAQFKAALKRNGLVKVPLGISRPGSNVQVGCILHPLTFRIMRRASLKRAVKYFRDNSKAGGAA